LRFAFLESPGNGFSNQFGYVNMDFAMQNSSNSYGMNGPSSTALSASMMTHQASVSHVTNPTSSSSSTKPSELLFVAPVKPNRLLYTDTYIKYIERLKPDCKHVTNWATQMNATPENTFTGDRSKLPAHWLANREGNHGSVVNALWALRNYMFQDALNLSHI
jgi:hypothetical protein